MESNERQDFLINRARYPANEAAVFIENRVIVPDSQAPVYIDRLDRFAPIEEARKQEQIRWANCATGCSGTESLTCN